jgi:hypothetical protein
MIKPPPVVSLYPRRFKIIRNMLTEARTAETYEQRAPLIEKAISRLDALERRVLGAAQERGRKGGTKTAERGPEYFRKIAAMRKTKGGGRPKKQADQS